MKIPSLDLAPQYNELKAEIDAAVLGVLRDGAFIHGPQVARLEQSIAKYFGVKHAVALNSGTDALVIGLRALGLNAGDEVITSSFSFFATAEAVSAIGAKPIFVDIDPATLNLNPSLLKAAITKRTKAIIPVHLFGRAAPMGEIMQLAKTHGLAVLEDCAQCFGGRSSEMGNQLLGTIGHAGAISFFPSKNLGGIGDGGMLITQEDKVADEAQRLRTHGGKKKYYNEVVGYNSRLDTIQAAVLEVKLPSLDRWNKERRTIAARYQEQLAALPHLTLPGLPDGHVFHQFTLRVTNGKRDALQQYLEKQGIGAMIYYPVPIHQLPVYLGQYPSLPECEAAAKEVLSLPIWPGMPLSQVDKVCQAIRDFS
jgi:dTDP-4-amino-4,6-dideoxygalactose transaminase